MNTVVALADSTISNGDRSNLLSQRHIESSVGHAPPPPHQAYVSVKSKETDMTRNLAGMQTI